VGTPSSPLRGGTSN